MIAASAVEQLVNENDELRAQIAKYQTTDYQSLDDLLVKSIIAFHDNHFTSGDRVRLKHRPDITGTIMCHKVFWLTYGSTITCQVLFDRLPGSISVIPTALEPLPEADDAKQ
ncbi:hypothetical protein ACH8KY_005092 [Salmonella enterica subsp. enterica serovar Braenderup]